MRPPDGPEVGMYARVIRGPWRGFHGPVTATFAGGWVTVRVACMDRTFSAGEIETVKREVTA